LAVIEFLSISVFCFFIQQHWKKWCTQMSLLIRNMCWSFVLMLSALKHILSRSFNVQFNGIQRNKF
jgi:hypothetical protein